MHSEVCLLQVWPTLQLWSWRQYIPSKHEQISITLHDVTSIRWHSFTLSAGTTSTLSKRRLYGHRHEDSGMFWMWNRIKITDTEMSMRIKKYQYSYMRLQNILQNFEWYDEVNNGTVTVEVKKLTSEKISCKQKMYYPLNEWYRNTHGLH
jgi:hypothetical protein